MRVNAALFCHDISYHSVRAAAVHLLRRFFTARRAKRESWPHAQTFVLLLCSRCAGKITQQVEAKIACTNVQECLGVTPYTSLPTATFNSRTANSQCNGFERHKTAADSYVPISVGAKTLCVTRTKRRKKQKNFRFFLFHTTFADVNVIEVARAKVYSDTRCFLSWCLTSLVSRFSGSALF